MCSTSSLAESRSAQVQAESAGARFDKWLAEAFPELSRSRLKVLIEEGQAQLDGATITDPSRRVKSGQLVELTLPAPEPAKPEAESIPLDIRYEDEHLLVINKAAGMVVHPAPGSPSATLVNALLAHCGDSLSGIGGVKRPGIVHRIDKDTSGLIVVAKNDIAHRKLAAQFAKHSLDRAYQALVWGVPTLPIGDIVGNIGRSTQDRKKMAVLRVNGKTALTRYKVLKSWYGAVSLVECRLATGRTHQIRVHMAHIGHPLVGDPLYGRGRPAVAKLLPEVARALLLAFPRQALHAVELGFLHPILEKPYIIKSELSRDIKELLESL
jgi:23S rRNA pseudouridine1911/1915/1917 synthase